MVGAEALLVDGQRAAHQRLGLGQPVGGLQQLRQVVEVGGDVGMVGAEALLVDGERAAHQRLGLGQPVGGLQQLRQVVEADGDVGMVGRRSSSRRWRARGASAARPRPAGWWPAAAAPGC